MASKRLSNRPTPLSLGHAMAMKILRLRGRMRAIRTHGQSASHSPHHMQFVGRSKMITGQRIWATALPQSNRTRYGIRVESLESQRPTCSTWRLQKTEWLKDYGQIMTLKMDVPVHLSLRLIYRWHGSSLEQCGLPRSKRSPHTSTKTPLPVLLEIRVLQGNSTLAGWRAATCKPALSPSSSHANRRRVAFLWICTISAEMRGSHFPTSHPALRTNLHPHPRIPAKHRRSRVRGSPCWGMSRWSGVSPPWGAVTATV